MEQSKAIKMAIRRKITNPLRLCLLVSIYFLPPVVGLGDCAALVGYELSVFKQADGEPLAVLDDNEGASTYHCVRSVHVLAIIRELARPIQVQDEIVDGRIFFAGVFADNGRVGLVGRDVLFHVHLLVQRLQRKLCAFLNQLILALLDVVFHLDCRIYERLVVGVE